jgi:hypothetical protein
VARRTSSPFAARTGKPASPQRSTRAIDAIVIRRQQLVAELAMLRKEGGDPTFIENAQQLLTRWWAGANWAAREDILKSATWLVRMSQCRKS